MYRIGAFASTGQMIGYGAASTAYRGRGIAQALKLKAIERARQYGARSIRTNNNAKNAPMLAINHKLGYQAQPGEYMLAERMPTVTD